MSRMFVRPARAGEPRRSDDLHPRNPYQPLSPSIRYLPLAIAAAWVKAWKYRRHDSSLEP